MSSAALIEALEGQIEEAERLKSSRYDCPELKGWKAKTKSLIRRTKERDFLKQFEGLSFLSVFISVGDSDARLLARHQPVYKAGLTEAQGILRGLIEVLQVPGPEPAPKKKPPMGFLREDKS